jgi:hypothetical protein
MELANIIPFLDVAIGLLILHALIALFVMILVERISTALEWRTKVLQDGLCDLLNDPDGFFVRALLCHPLVTPNMDYKYSLDQIRVIVGRHEIPLETSLYSLVGDRFDVKTVWNRIGFNSDERNPFTLISYVFRFVLGILFVFYDFLFARLLHYYRWQHYRKGRYAHHALKGPSYISSVVFADIIFDMMTCSVFFDTYKNFPDGDDSHQIPSRRDSLEHFFENLSLLASGHGTLFFEEPARSRYYWGERPIYDQFYRVALRKNDIFRDTPWQQLPFIQSHSFHEFLTRARDFGARARKPDWVFNFLCHETPNTLISATRAIWDRHQVRLSRSQRAQPLARHNVQVNSGDGPATPANPEVTDELRATLANWFDVGMDRLTGIYKRRVFGACLVLSVLISLMFNVDTLKITRDLWSQANSINRAAYTEVLREAYDCKNKTESNAASCEKVNSKEPTLEEYSLPLGYGEIGKKAWIDLFDHFGISISWFFPPDKLDSKPEKTDFSKMIYDIIIKAIGLLLSAAAITLMAPIWFDLLNYAFNLRGTGKKPDKLPLPSLWLSKGKE